MRAEWNFFKQTEKGKNIYRFFLILLLLFYLYYTYLLSNSKSVVPPWSFVLLDSVGLDLSRNLMPTTFYLVGLLFPLRFFSNYLCESRDLEEIRREKKQIRYSIHFFTSAIYVLCYFTFNTLIMKILGLQITSDKVIQGALYLLLLLAIAAFFSVLDFWNVGIIIATALIISCSYYRVPTIPILLVSNILIFTITNYFYLNREIL